MSSDTDNKSSVPSPRSGNWKSIGFQQEHYAKPVVIDNKSLLIASSNGQQNVYKYDILKKKFKVIFKYPSKLEPSQVTTCINHNANKMYFYCNYSTTNDNCFMEYDTVTKKLNIHKNLLKNTGAYPVIVCLSGTIHLIGGRINNLHLVWDRSRNKFIEYPFRSKMIHGHCVIPIETTKQIIIMGGNDSHLFGGYLHHIYVCETIPNIKWTLMKDVKMPYKVYGCGYIKTKDEVNIVIFGGKTKTGLKDEIWILSLQTLQWTKSNIKCPKRGKFHAVKSRDGYVHLFEIDTKSYWKINIGMILGTRTKSNSLSLSIKSPQTHINEFKFDVDDNKNNNNNHNNNNNINATSITNDRLKKDLIKAKAKIDALIQQNIKLNQDMAKMEKIHKEEIHALKKKYQKYKKIVNKTRSSSLSSTDQQIQELNQSTK